jgi:AAA domain/DnaB-like helicase N terminal domain
MSDFISTNNMSQLETYQETPHSKDAEKIVLGAILIDNALIFDACRLLNTSDFYSLVHRHIFTAMLSLNKAGKEINAVLLFDEIKTNHDLPLNMTSVSQINMISFGLPRFNDIESYCNIIREKTLLRNMLKSSLDLQTSIYSGDVSADQLFAISQRSFKEYEQLQSVRIGMKTVSMVDVESRLVEWLWYPFIPANAFTIVDGIEDIGKSWVMLALATAVAGGQGYGYTLGNDTNDTHKVLLAIGEDDLGDTIKPRLESMNANMENITAVQERFSFADKRDLLKLEVMLERERPKLFIIDPIFSYTGRGNVNTSGDVRPIVDAMNSIAQKYHCAILAVRHIGKAKGGGDARAAGLGGIEWRAAARSALLIGVNHADNKRFVTQTKGNLAPSDDWKDQGLGYEIRKEGTHGKFYWLGKVKIESRQLLLFEDNDDAKADKRTAITFLTEELKYGERKTKDLMKEGERIGLSYRMLYRASESLPIEKYKVGNARSDASFWEWKWTGELEKEE